MTDSHMTSTTDTASPLDQVASEAIIEGLYASGHLLEVARDASLARLSPPLAWWTWASRMMLLLGSTLVMAGIVFFFAYNWAKMGAFSKFAVIEIGLVACLVGAWFVRLERVVGQVLLLAASALVGVLLAVYGQTYQTGADPYELFVGWSLLIFGWVAISRFGILWLMWMLISDVGIVLLWLQVILPRGLARPEGAGIVLALVNAAVLVVGEYATYRRHEWVAARWVRRITLLTVLCALCAPTLALILAESSRHIVSWFAAGLLVASWVGAYEFYRYRDRDLGCLTLIALSVCAVVLTLIGRLLFETPSDPITFLFFGLIVVGVCSAATYWLHWISKSMAGESHG